ncbi:hypothetical protein EDB84DRAFT_1568454 [Lactarius hengduanensis]|nr:hypothetical protein EDB84DRAFT_1568454 [Lactarius hengduanensis]
MSLTLYLKRELEEPFKLAVHGSSHIYSSMASSTRLAVTASRTQRASSQFLDALRTHATDDLHTAALEYGTIPQGLAAIHRRDRQHDGQADEVRSGSPGLGRCRGRRRRILDRRGAHATQLAVEAVAIRIKARADAEVADEFAQETSRRRQEIQRIAAFGHKAVFVPTEVMDVAS